MMPNVKGPDRTRTEILLYTHRPGAGGVGALVLTGMRPELAYGVGGVRCRAGS